MGQPGRVVRPWTAGEVNRAAAMRAGGMKAAAIGRRLGRTAMAVCHQLRRLGHGRFHFLSAATRDAIRERCRKGQSTASVARGLGCDHKTVAYWRKKFGIPSLSPSEAARCGNYTRTQRPDGWNNPYRLAADAARVKAFYAGWPPVSARQQEFLEAVEAGADTAAKFAARFGMSFPAAVRRLAAVRRAGHVTAAKGATWIGTGNARRREVVFSLAPAVAAGRAAVKARAS